MHGYRAFADVLASIVRAGKGVAHVDLFEDADWQGEGLSLILRQQALSPLRSVVTVEVARARRDAARVAVRRPAWASAARLSLNGARVDVPEKDGYLHLERSPRTGDRLEVAFEQRAFVEARDGRRLALDETREATGSEPLFFGEPWLAGNEVQLPRTLQAPPAPALRAPFSTPRRHVAASYAHAGFAGTYPVTLRPVAEQAGRAPGITAAWLRYRPR
jgi:hypothetical protein